MVPREVLCMRSSDDVNNSRGRRYAARLAGIVLLCSIIAAAEVVAQFSFDSVHMADYYLYDIRKLEETNTDVGMVIVGASQVYHACIPDVISEELGIGEVIDASTASMTNDGGYYLLKDLLKRFTPKYVLVNLGWNCLIKRTPEGEKRGRLLAMDRLPYLLRLDYLFRCFPFSEYPNISNMYRFGGTIWGLSQIKKNYQEKKAVRDGNWISEEERNYRKNGFALYKRSSEQGNIEAEENYYSDELIDTHEAEYIRKMQELCEKEGVELIWITIPTSMEELYSIENLQENIDHIRAFTEESGHPWLNFNLLRGREETLPDTSYTDNLHVNGVGAEFFSYTLAETVSMLERGEDVSGLFYDSVDEMKADVERIVACGADISQNGDGDTMVEARSLQNEDVIPEYRILISKFGGDYEEVCPWQEENTFLIDRGKLPPDSILRLEVRPAGQKEYDAFQEVEV